MEAINKIANILKTHNHKYDQLTQYKQLAASVLWSGVLDYWKLKRRMDKATKPIEKRAIASSIEAVLFDLESGLWHDILEIGPITEDMCLAAESMLAKHHKHKMGGVQCLKAA